MERAMILRRAYDAGIEVAKAEVKRDEIKKGVHVFNPRVGDVLDAIVVAYTEGIKCVIIHADLKFRQYDPREDEKSPQNLPTGKFH